jgi:hypothetical protein
MKIYLLIPLLFLAGCQTAVERNFPDIPPGLSSRCENLQLIPEDTTKMSQLLSVVTDNYNQYLTCQAKVEAWQSWYVEQKEIFQSIH